MHANRLVLGFVLKNQVNFMKRGKANNIMLRFVVASGFNFPLNPIPSRHKLKTKDPKRRLYVCSVRWEPARNIKENYTEFPGVFLLGYIFPGPHKVQNPLISVHGRNRKSSPLYFNGFGSFCYALSSYIVISIDHSLIVQIETDIFVVKHRLYF